MTTLFPKNSGMPLRRAPGHATHLPHDESPQAYFPIVASDQFLMSSSVPSMLSGPLDQSL